MGHRDSIAAVGGRRLFWKTPRLLLLLERLDLGAVGICDRGKLARASFTMALSLCGCYPFGTGDQPCA